MTLSLLTLNTWKADGDYTERLRRLSEGLRRLRPDVIALQECFLSEDGQADTARDLALALGHHVSVVRARGKRRLYRGREVMSHSCLAVLSRWPIVQSTDLALPTSAQDGGRLAQVVRLAAGEVALTLANVHLTHVSDTDLRRRQLRAVMQHLQGLGPSGLTVLAGDCNEEADGPALCGAAEHLQDAVAAWGHGREPTHWDEQGQGRVLDHVFVLPHLSQRALRVIGAGVVLPAQPQGMPQPTSDHSAVWVRWAWSD